MHHRTLLSLLALVAPSHGQTGYTTVPLFAYEHETSQITLDDIEANRAVGYADAPPDPAVTVECKAFPGTPEWPSDAEWARLNASLGGVLLKPAPAGAACYSSRPEYDASRCAAVLSSQALTRGFLDDPLAVGTPWTSGDPCPPALKPAGECSQGGLPVYVVNATSVKHVQMAVNFARNKNIRFVVRNTGHDFVGRSTGAGALSLWTHHLKDFDVIPKYVSGPASGPAVHAGAGLQAWEVHEAMAKHNITLVAPTFATVGAFGGYLAGGGHSSLISYHGLASDQVLAINLVTPDGSFTSADPVMNPDLFFALRGGGANPFGVITSVVVKAHPPLNLSSTVLAISNLDTGTDLFWKAMAVYFRFGRSTVDARGTDRTYITPYSNSTVLNFTTTIDFPGLSPQAASSLLAPLEASLRALGINITFQYPTVSRWADNVIGEGAALRDQRFASRLIPRATYDDDAKFAGVMSAIRTVVEEGGYPVHGTHMAPTLRVAGYPGADSAANPAFREAVMHLVVYDSAPSSTSPGVTATADHAARSRLSGYVDYLRNATVGSGSYVNEADVLEPDWQRSFYGANYETLLQHKTFRDPWDLFWAPGAVGSEAWTVRAAGGLPTQNGRLCRTAV
ncbi:FAD/FMN-containing isoamyl alcohol oxidase-like protein MreA [Echria macrotheca]|uniref:FAD/FMN-containing isoamyl alcohol oxidase-like protein MreA n=1 Tax=Echria macrotheca TaxID=438768 RepID=A0AAJ0B475_9PEZI|nr:FAD/FMN-containing isoamyl alcohol oxidase-like protein MreA [Echria macrotheca]